MTENIDLRTVDIMLLFTRSSTWGMGHIYQWIQE